jgi:cardiolipin synthase
MIVDAMGSWGTRSRSFDPLRAAGGQFAWSHPVVAKSWPYWNHCTHRKLLVIDGEVGFIGGAGFADQWLNPMLRVPVGGIRYCGFKEVLFPGSMLFLQRTG